MQTPDLAPAAELRQIASRLREIGADLGPVYAPQADNIARVVEWIGDIVGSETEMAALIARLKSKETFHG